MVVFLRSMNRTVPNGKWRLGPDDTEAPSASLARIAGSQPLWLNVNLAEKPSPSAGRCILSVHVFVSP